MKNRSLAPLYLALMHSFVDNQRDLSDWSYLSNTEFLQQFGFLRIDGGRMTGKSYATAQFCAEWIAEGNSVVLVGHNTAHVRELKNRIQGAYRGTAPFSINNPGKDAANHNVVCTNLRDYMNPQSITFRGVRLPGRLLVVFDEVMNFPGYVPVLEAHFKTVAYTNQCRTDPIFFVIGI